MLNFSFWGISKLYSPSSPINNIHYLEIKNSIIDELHIRGKTNILSDNIRNHWQTDTRLLAKFKNSLTAGNIDNQGIPITRFAIKRRKRNALDSITLAYLPFINDSEVEYTDFTQSNGEFIYSIVPVDSNGLEGKPNDVIIESDFTGWWIVDNDISAIFAFDTTLDDETRTVDSILNQDKIIIETLSKYPQIYYSDKEYHSFTLSAVVATNDYSFNEYTQLVNMITQHKSLIVKGSSGDIYVCDVSVPQKSSLLKAYKTNDYIDLTVECTEIMDYKEYMKEREKDLT